MPLNLASRDRPRRKPVHAACMRPGLRRACVRLRQRLPAAAAIVWARCCLGSVETGRARGGPGGTSGRNAQLIGASCCHVSVCCCGEESQSGRRRGRRHGVDDGWPTTDGDGQGRGRGERPRLPLWPPMEPTDVLGGSLSRLQLGAGRCHRDYCSPPWVGWQHRAAAAHRRRVGSYPRGPRRCHPDLAQAPLPRVISRAAIGAVHTTCVDPPPFCHIRVDPCPRGCAALLP